MNVLVQLDSDEDISMQRKDMFIPVGGKDESLVQSEGFAVMKYKRSWVGNSPTIYIPKKTCLLIPAGEQVHLRLEGPPKQVFNMRQQVTFFTSPRAEPHTRLDQLVWAVLGKPKTLTTNWREMRDQWDEVDDRPFHAKALMARYIPYPHAGGRVCVWASKKIVCEYLFRARTLFVSTQRSPFFLYTVSMSFPLQTITKSDYENHPLLARLLELHDVPERIHIAGHLPEIRIDEYGRATPRILTVVGSRNYTTYGKLAIEKLIASLAGTDVIILSGLALGIDGISHECALKHNIITIGIPGSGIDPSVIHPRTNLHIATDIVESGGALMSEYDPLFHPAQWTFVARNRIMAALADAVLIVEAHEKSGTLVTARLALELGKDIGAIPGDIFSASSQGTNMLIKEGAYMIRNSGDLYDLLHIKQQEQKTSTQTYSSDEERLLTLLVEPMEKDTLLIRSELPLTLFLTAFSSLEMKGVIIETFGEVRKIV
jgi:DNA processing protein